MIFFPAIENVYVYIMSMFYVYLLKSISWLCVASLLGVELIGVLPLVNTRKLNSNWFKDKEEYNY